MNIYSNFTPNEIKTIRSRKTPWMTKAIENPLRNKNCVFFGKGQPDDTLESMQKMVSEGSKMVEGAKQNYFLKVGKVLANPETCSKTYWSLINTVLNKAKVPLIPPIPENGIFTTDFTEKA